MKVDKVKSYLGFAIRSGKVIFGVDKLFDSKKKAQLILICSTQNEKVTNKVVRYAKNENIPYIKLKDLVVGEIVSRDNCKVIGILDINLAQAVKNEFQMESYNN